MQWLATHPERSGSGSLIRWTFSPSGCSIEQLHSVILIKGRFTTFPHPPTAW
ncbi:hypothetical protein [Membranihabitans marinus]|uniref:hypothetical protein n=1 Tax=Membranihabitans marinus TaxID=1227546 RepID=UPI001F2F12ED|nr:hypothetical protein [Membranihabitans marinus]